MEWYKKYIIILATTLAETGKILKSAILNSSAILILTAIQKIFTKTVSGFKIRQIQLELW
jgi:hypothetical protein